MKSSHDWIKIDISIIEWHHNYILMYVDIINTWFLTRDYVCIWNISDRQIVFCWQLQLVSFQNLVGGCFFLKKCGWQYHGPDRYKGVIKSIYYIQLFFSLLGDKYNIDEYFPSIILLDQRTYPFPSIKSV